MPEPEGLPTLPPARRLVTVAAFASLFVFAISAVILPATQLRAAADLSVDAALLVRGTAVQFGGYVLATLVGGFFCARAGKKLGLQGACLLMALGAGLTTLARGLGMFYLAIAVLGMGGGVLESMASALLTDIYPTRRRQVLALSQVAFCVGAAAGPVAMALLLPRGVSWRLFFVAEAVLALALFALYSATSVPRPQRPPPPPRDGRPPVWVRASFLLPAVVMFLYVLSENGVIVYVNPYLQQQRMAPEQWGIYGISLIWLAMIVGRLLCAGLPERFPSERLIAGLCVAGAASLGAQDFVRDWRVSFALFGVTGFLFAGVWPLIVAVTAGRHPLRTGTAVGVTIAAGALGAAAGPLAVSALLRASMAALILPLLAVPLLVGAAALPLAGGAQASSKDKM